MTMYFSKTNGFQLTEIHGENIAKGSVEITYDEYHQLLDGQTAGLLIEVNDNGRPYLAAKKEPTLSELKSKSLMKLNKDFEQRIGAIKKGYTDSEIQSWNKQEAEARAYVADALQSTPLLTALAASREIPLSLLVDKVIEKANLFAISTGTLIGKRQMYENAILKADATTLEAINWID